jgi:tRNA-guanine family transglycosylase
MTAFAVAAGDGSARAGVLRTAHGEVRKPVFMPVVSHFRHGGCRQT